ncbi:MAG: patatin-like phospholipase family protein [Egibacteraceae bacterium]
MRLGLVLAGGGAKGAFEAGVVAAVEEAGLRPTVLSGTSAGALNAAGIASGMDAARLAELWTGTAARDVHRLRRDVWRLLRLRGLFGGGGRLAGRLLDGIGWTWALETTPLRRTLERALGGVAVDVVDGLTLAVSAVEVASGELVRFVNRLPPERRRSPRFREVAPTVDHLMASAAIPILFRPAPVAGRDFWDGGLVANTPLAPALAYEPDAAIVVTTATRQRPSPPPQSLGQAVSLLIDNVLAYSLAADLARAEAVNVACLTGAEVGVKRAVDLLVIEPTGLDLGHSLDFDPALAAARVAQGVAADRHALAGWERLR